MKILLVFPMADKQTGVYIYNAFISAGCEVKTIDPRINYHGMISTIRKWEPDLVFTNRQPQFVDEIFYIRSNFPKVIVACWQLDKRDSIYEFPRNLLTYFSQCHLLYVTALGQIEEYEKACPLTQIKHLQEAIDPEIYHKEILTNEDHKKYDCDVLFLGDKDNPLFHGRKELIEFLLSQNDLDVKIFGSKGLPYLLGEDFNKACQCAKINLGNTGWPNIELCMSARDYRIMGTGGFLLTEHVKGIEKWFPVGIALDTYKSKEECLDKIITYSINEDSRNRMAQKGYSLVHSKHKFIDRIKEILKDVKNYENHCL